jgi:DNA-binding MarR family transcriptional regulator
MSSHDLEALVEAVAELRARVVPLVLARQERRSRGASAGERLSAPQHLTLLALANGPLAVTEVAGATGVAVSTATRMVQWLERAGWVARQAPPPGADRRRRPVSLTPEGRRVMDDATEAVRERLRGLLGRLDERGRAAVLDGLEALALALQEEEAARPEVASSASSRAASRGAGGDSADAPSGRMPSMITPR